MSDLTEKWKNGELPDGRYYIKINDNIFIARLSFDTFFIGNSPWKKCVKEILAPVPSYEEWQELQEENRALAMGSFPMMLEAAKKIDKLEELLGKCYRFLRLTETKVEAIEKVKRGIVKEIDEVLK